MIRDEELCQQLQQGSEAAMEALVHRHHRPVFAYLYRLLGNRHTAEDLTQETFAKLLANIAGYRFPQLFKPWLYTIAHNLYKDYVKAPANRSTHPAPDPVGEAPVPVDISERIAERAEVTSALRALDPSQREVLLLRYYQDLKVDQIAAIIGVPSGTVKSRLFGAMQKLRTLLTGERAEGRECHEATGRRNRP